MQSTILFTYRMCVEPGPSLRLVLDLTDAFGEVSVAVLRSAWTRWIGAERFDRKLQQMAHAGWAEWRGTAYLDRVIRLTAAGRLAAIGGREPQARWSRSWDGRWRIVVFDIPENMRGLRRRLRDKLRELGFGYLQDSVWISPDPAHRLHELVHAARVDTASFTVMEARPCAQTSDGDLVKGAWDFARINRNYGVYLEILKSAPRCWDSATTRRSWFRAEFQAWHRAFRLDPLLPEQLLPKNYLGRYAWAQRQAKLHNLLR